MANELNQSRFFEDKSTQTPADVSTQTEPEEEFCSNFMFDPMLRQTIKINPSFRRNRRKEEFDAVKFLLNKKLEQDFYSLEFQSDDDIQDELGIINSSPDKKRINLLGEGMLRKIAENLENLNRINNYRMLDVHYEKNR